LVFAKWGWFACFCRRVVSRNARSWSVVSSRRTESCLNLPSNTTKWWQKGMQVCNVNLWLLYKYTVESNAYLPFWFSFKSSSTKHVFFGQMDVPPCPCYKKVVLFETS
jgi:hypothetical protein